MLSIIWTIIIGFVAGVIAKLLHPGRTYEPSGFIMTTVLGIVGAFVATYLGQAVGWYKAGESAGFIGAIVGRDYNLGSLGNYRTSYTADLKADFRTKAHQLLGGLAPMPAEISVEASFCGGNDPVIR